MSQIRTKFIQDAAVTNVKLATGIDAAKVADGSVSNAEFQRLDGITSGIQTQLDSKQTRATLTTKGDIYVATAADTVVRQGVGTDGTFLKSDSSATNGITYASVVSTSAFRSVTTTDTATTGDDVLVLSGASFTETLFTAVGNTGKILTLIHNGTSLTQVYTIDGAGAETIGGAATYIMRLSGHRVRIISDGANWIILNESVKYVDSAVHVDSGNGHGSTNTKIRRFTNTRKNVGTAITYADSSTLGASFTINQTGLYSISYNDSRSASSDFMGISVSTSAPTTDISSLTYAQGIRAITTSPAAGYAQCSITLELVAGDVVRAHTRGAHDNTAEQMIFVITKVSDKLGV